MCKLFKIKQRLLIIVGRSMELTANWHDQPLHGLEGHMPWHVGLVDVECYLTGRATMGTIQSS